MRACCGLGTQNTLAKAGGLLQPRCQGAAVLSGAGWASKEPAGHLKGRLGLQKAGWVSKGQARPPKGRLGLFRACWASQSWSEAVCSAYCQLSGS
jgi:hypothetical protein